MTDEEAIALLAEAIKPGAAPVIVTGDEDGTATTLLGVITDADGDEIEVSADGDGTVALEWEHGSAMILGPAARDQLRELLDRAAMPGRTSGALNADLDDSRDQPSRTPLGEQSW